MSAEFVRNSMRHLPTEVRATKEKFRQENDLVIQAEIQKAIPVNQVQSLRTAADATPLPLEKAQWIAAAESTALIHQEAEAYLRFPGMHTFYRVFRTHGEDQKRWESVICRSWVSIR